MGSTLPYLQPGEISEISDSLNLECIDYPVSNHDDWLKLYTALGMRDAIKINEITNKLLQDTKQWPIQQIRFLLIVKFLSLIVLEDYASVISYWDHYINKILENDMRFIYETLFEFANFHSRPGE